MDTPLVSVILTVFRRTDYLEHAIRSVTAQEFTSWECIVTDDANSDAAKQICALFSADSRVRYRANATALGAPLNVAAALREARGKYVAVLNDDDLLEPGMLRTLVPHLEESQNVVLAFGNYRIIDSQGNDLPKATSGNLRRRGRGELAAGVIPTSFEFAVRRNVMVVIGCLFRKRACDLNWFREEVRGAYDYWLAIRLGEVGDFYFTPATVAAWRQHQDSVSGRHSRDVFRAEVFIYRTLCNTLSDKRILGYTTCQLARFECLRGKELLAHWSPREARSTLRDSLKTQASLLACLLWMLTFLPGRVRGPLLQMWYRTFRLRARCGLSIFRTG